MAALEEEPCMATSTAIGELVACALTDPEKLVVEAG